MKVRFYFALLMTIVSINAFSQTLNFDKKIPKFEDKNGNLITNPKIIATLLLKRKQDLEKNFKQNISRKVNQTPVQLCSNGALEEFENVLGGTFLKNFEYAVTGVQNPIQCETPNVTAGQMIKQYNPNDNSLMATTVPSNYLDEYIGNIDAYDQYCMKINYKNSSETMTLVQAKRFKTDNENTLVFNYKAVLQSIEGDAHKDEQPFFKARIVNNAGVVVSEFCLIADTQNCIFTVAPSLEAGSIVLYTKNWQSGILDISSIPNNENFTVEFMTTRCGLGGHFGYSYIDDICLLHSSENLQGSIQLDPLYKVCPTLPLQVCGSFTIPNSGGIAATVKNITLKIYDSANNVAYITTATSSLDLITKRFCFNLAATNLPNILTGSYNASVTIDYNVTQTNCLGTSFKSATDDDANPGWDIWFLNCDPTCTTTVLTATLNLCDNDQNGKEIFDLNNLNTQIAGTQTGLTFTYFNSLSDATANTNPILNFLTFNSYTATIFVRVSTSATCYKIIATRVVVKNPKANISGILNICGGPTTLTATKGVGYLWSTGAISQSIQAPTIGTYTVAVTDTFGCTANGSVTILANTVAPLPTIKITQPSCLATTGTIEVTSSASSYSFDGGLTWGTNSIKSNVPIGSYLVRIQTAAGCTSYDNKIDIVSYLSSFPLYSKVDPTFCGDLGSIVITDTAPFYSFDDGLTWGTVASKTGLASGSYRIRTKDNAGCISNYNNVELKGDFLPDPTFTIDQPYCGNTGSITITTPGAVSYSFDGGTIWQPTATLSGLVSGSYVIMIKNALGCTSTTAYVYLIDLEYSYPQYKIIDAGCGQYATITITSIGDKYSFDGGTTWSTIPFLDNQNGGTSYQLMVKKGATCVSYTQNAYINSNYYPIPLASDFSVTLCDDLNDNQEIIDLSVYNQNIIALSTNFNFEYYTTKIGAENADNSVRINNFASYTMNNTINTVYVRVISLNNCFKVVKLFFAFIDSPRIIMVDRYPICTNKTVTIGAGFGYYSYLWSTGQKTQSIVIKSPGLYYVTVAEIHGSLICTTTKNFEIYESNFAKITKITTQDWTDNENVITVFETGLGKYEYSIDGKEYQDSNIFSGLNSGDYTVYIRDKFGCGVVTEEVFLLMHPKYFSPNNDGFNDFWNVQFSEKEPNFDIKIFDRAGKFLKQLSGLSEGWNGMLNGQMLPADDYWFIVKREDGREYKGHFTLKR